MFIFIFICLIPSVLDRALQHAENFGNMGLYGVFLEIYRLRNIVYISLVILLISYFYNYLLLGSGIFLCSLFFYIKSIYNWRHVINSNFIQNN